MNGPDTLLVIPSYRDGARLAVFLPTLCAELERGAGGVQVQVVDDGSPASEQMWLTAEIDRVRRAHSFLQPLVALPANGGKGHAVRAGWATANGPRWLAFVDADGASPAAEVAALLAQARQADRPAVFIAVRSAAADKPVTRFWHRRLGSRIFNAWVRRSLGIDLPDTQCGLKVIPTSLHTGSVWHEDGFAFDLELLLKARAAGLPVVTRAVAWSEQPGSSVGISAVLALFAAVWRLRRMTAQRDTNAPTSRS